MEDDRRPGRAPDYTTAFLWSALPVVFIALCTIWVAVGFVAAGLSGWLVDREIVRRARG